MKTAIPRRGQRLSLTLAVLLGLTLAKTTPMARADLPKVPDDWDIRLVAAVPAVTYPCQVACGPDGALYIAENPMDQTGPPNQPIDRILVFREGEEPVVFAENLAAVFGMAWRDDALYVMHLPFLSVLRDTNGDGKADERHDLFTDLGLQPGQPNNLNDHIVSGIQFGMDGKLYISVGDKGVPHATGPEGRVVQLVGGGILRCNPDGTDLEVFSTGTRNHLEPNLDHLDRLFTYDNTDDGDGWWTRVTYHIDGAHYGYPYDYHNHRHRMLDRIAEYGGGSPCGGVVVRDTRWPARYQGSVIWAEWGKAKVQAFLFEPDGAGFKVKEVVDLVQAGPLSDFRPIDLALSPDGATLYIADWGMGGWGNKTENVGRVFALTPRTLNPPLPRGSDTDPLPTLIAALDHADYSERLRAQQALIRRGGEALTAAARALNDPATTERAGVHLVWVVDGVAGGSPEALMPLLAAFGSPHAEVRAQAARAVGLRNVPIAGTELVGLLSDSAPQVRLQALIALGRAADPKTVAAIVPFVGDRDPYLKHAAQVALRRVAAWSATVEGLNHPDPAVRKGLIETLERVADLVAARALADFAADVPHHPADERAYALSMLAAGYRLSPPWDGKWWGTRPTQGRPFPRTIDWAGTSLIHEAILARLSDPAPEVRRAAIAAARLAQLASAAPTIRQRLANEPETAIRLELATALGELPDPEGQSQATLIALATNAACPAELRSAAVESVGKLATTTPNGWRAVLDLLDAPTTEADALKALIELTAERRVADALEPIARKLTHPHPTVRAAAARGCGRLKLEEMRRQPLRDLLNDPEASVRVAAAEALGQLTDRVALPALIKRASDGNEAGEVRFAATGAICLIPDLAALPIYLDALGGKNADLRRAAAQALGMIRDQAAPVLDQLASRRELPARLLPELRDIYRTRKPLRSWKVIGPFREEVAPPFPIADGRTIDFEMKVPGRSGREVSFLTVAAVDDQGEINLGRLYGEEADHSAFAVSEIVSDRDRPTEFAVGSDDTLTIWLNGQKVFEFSGNRSFAHAQNTFTAPLRAGTNQVVVHCGNRGGGWQFSVQYADDPQYAFLNESSDLAAFDPDRYRDVALKTPGDPAKGRALFFDLQGLACVKCHAVGAEGGKVGPDLTDVGAKYPKEELITAILQPSAKISSGYESVVVLTLDGAVINGILKAETDALVELEDGEGRRLTIKKEEIELVQRSEVSLMPSGLADGLTPRDFADLIEYLSGLRGHQNGSRP